MWFWQKMSKLKIRAVAGYNGVRNQKMARRKQLKGVAGNLVQWFLSRNFDYKGYWAVGQLYAFAEENKTNNIILNLKENKFYPESGNGKFGTIFEIIDSVFSRDLKANKIPDWWVAKATVIFSFNEPYKHKYHYFRSALGQPLMCTVEITTDIGRTYVKKLGCNCWVHDPNKEHRRYGF